MAFFGVELKPAKPFTHSSDKAKGRLRISQATLGIGSSTKKSLVQCNVGKNSPVLLCVLMPDKTESCHLDLEFDEKEDVVFSVIGPRSVYLTGYYVCTTRHYNGNSDSESFGEDVGNTGSEQSDYCSDDDEYEDSFIDDTAEEVLPSPVLSDEVTVVDASASEVNKTMGREGNFKRLKKRYQVIESDDSRSSDGSGDNYLLSVFKTKKSGKAVPSEVGEDTDRLNASTGVGTENPASKGSELKELVELVNDEPVREANHVSSSLLVPDDVFSEEGVKEDKHGVDNTHDKLMAKDICENMPVSDGNDQKQSLHNEVASVNHEKPKKRRKVQHRDVEICEAKNGSDKEVKAAHTEPDSGNIQPDLRISDKQTSATNMEIDVHPSKKGGKNGLKTKKRRNEPQGESVEGSQAQTESVKGEQLEQDIVKIDNTVKDVPARTEEEQIPSSNNEIDACPPKKGGKVGLKTKKRRKELQGESFEGSQVQTESLKGEQLQQDIVKTGNMVKEVPARTDEEQIPISNKEVDARPPKNVGKSGPKTNKRRKELQGESIEGSQLQTESVEEQLQQDIVKTDNTEKDVPARTDEEKIRSSNKDIEVKPDVWEDGCLSEKKTQKKKKKVKTRAENKDENPVKLEAYQIGNKDGNPATTEATQTENQDRKSAASEVRTLSNGMTIEELAKGEPGGKVAAPGKRVKVYYTAWLQKTGHVFDSNTGKLPQTFQLGKKEIIEGWNVGIEGMHVGDKRRLTIPPSMGYGNQGTGENVPPNSWLVYEVELADVRR